MAALEAEIATLITGPLTTAIGNLERQELKLARAAFFKKFRPHCNTDLEAEIQVERSKTVQDICGRFYWYSYVRTPIENVERGLKNLATWVEPKEVV